MSAPSLPRPAGAAWAWRAELERIFSPDQPLTGVGTPALARLAAEALGKTSVHDEELSAFLLEVARQEDDTVADFAERAEQRALAIGACAWLFIPKPTKDDYDRFYPQPARGSRIQLESIAMRQSWAYYHYRLASLAGARQQRYGHRKGMQNRRLFQQALAASVERRLGITGDVGALPPVAADRRGSNPLAALWGRLRGLRRRTQVLAGTTAVLLPALAVVLAMSFSPRVPGDDATPDDPDIVVLPDPPSDSGSYWEASWGPQREMFTLASGGAPYPTFNSISDNPNLGDERNFVGLRPDTREGVPNVWSDDVWAEPGDTLIMRVYVNNAGTDSNGVVSAGWLQGVKLQVGISRGAQEVSVFGLLSATNSETVWDGATIHVDDGVDVVFDPDYALLENNAHPNGGLQLGPEAFSSDGVPLGYEEMDGLIEPGYQYAGYVGFRLNVIEATVMPPSTTSTSLGYWGPERDTFTIASGGAPYPIFNSITDNPNYGDERNFLTVKSTRYTNAGGWGDDVWANPGETFSIRALGENSGADNAGVVSAGALQDARIRLSVTSTANGDHVVRAELSAVNSMTVWDSVIIHTRPGVELDFDPVTLQLHNNIYPQGVALEGDPFSEDGALVGFETQDGVIPPGYRYDFFVIVEVTARTS